VPTLRRWTQEFAEALSPDARGGDGRPREFNGHDQRILRRVREILADPDVTYAQVRRHLSEEGLLASAPAEPPAKASTPTSDEREAAERFVQAILDRIAQPWLERIDRLEKEISALRQEITNLQANQTTEESTSTGRRRWPFG